ncbi:MAG: DNA polymerase III subunit alpha, partial [Ignavibacteriales bacterium CG12_big_fil_rev_8_21_14_0_65_30_8]
YGIAEFYRKAVAAGIKPIIGMEAYIVKEGSRFDKGTNDSDGGRKRAKHYNHLILLAKNRQGYKNLSKLSTLGHTEGFYYKPRIDLELLRKYREGIICSSACAGGIVASDLINSDYDKARNKAKTFKDIFGDDFYLEIQDHKMDYEKAVLEGMPKLSKELGIKLVATNDCHYIEQEHSIAHNILLLLADKTGRDYRDLRYKTDQIYFKSQDEMKALFKDHKSAIENTLEIDSKIDLKLDSDGYHFPNFPIPENSQAKTLDEYLEILAKEGLHKKFTKITDEIKERFDFELSTIKEMGFAGYFLIVQDFINAAKKNNIPVGPGRGSVAGSLVAFTLGITEIDPLKYNLLFERFLNPSRKSMPDIDIDFADDKRGDIIEYVRKKYGSDCVSQIITFNRLSSKMVLRDVARVLNIPIPTVNNITKLIPSKFGKVFTLDEAINKVPELKYLKTTKEPDLQNLIKYAKVLEGMNRNASKHAAGVVICPEEISNFVPLANAVNQTEVITQYNMKDIEQAGLLKMDFLGLRTLTIIRDTLILIKQNHNIEIDIEKIPLDDEKTYKLFSNGQTTGVFQFESPPMREHLKKLQPNSINDLAAMNALYRPGPMEFINEFIERKFGKTKVEYLHPLLEQILKETYGIIVYQEQVIQIANIIGGMSLADADLLRRAMGKKDLKSMAKLKKQFLTGALENGIKSNIAEKIVDNIEKFANYGFNKSHAVAYSLVAYQTAYLKAHYTPEFLAANLTNEFGNSNKVAAFLEDCRKLQIEVLPPDVNNPSVNFNVEQGKIRFGMSAIKNVGIPAVEELIKIRKQMKSNFKSIFNFCSKVDTRIVNKRGLEGLVLAGAFDSVTDNRASLFASIESALEFGNKVQNSKITLENSLFGDNQDEIKVTPPKLANIPKWNTRERLAREREVTGFYITGHPLKNYLLEYNSFATVQLGSALVHQNDEMVRACGVITSIKRKIDKSNRTMAFITLDDFSGSCECLMFATTYEKYGQYIEEEKCFIIVGKPESSGDNIKIHIEELTPMEQVKEKFTKSIKINLDEQYFGEKELSKLKSILNENKGNIPIYLHLKNNGSKGKLFFLKDFKVNPSNEFIRSMNTILGEDSIQLCQ